MAEDTPPESPPGKKGGLITGKYKWWVVGGLGLIAVLVFVFVRKSNDSAASSGGGGSTTSMDPATQAALQSALQAQSAAGYSYQAATGPQGPAGTPGTPKPKAPPPAKQSTTPNTQYYTVRAGDSLSKIAAQFHISGGWQ